MSAFSGWLHGVYLPNENLCTVVQSFTTSSVNQRHAEAEKSILFHCQGEPSKQNCSGRDREDIRMGRVVGKYLVHSV